METGDFGEDDITIIEDPITALDDTLRRAEQLFATMRTSLARIRETHGDARNFLARAIADDIRRANGHLEYLGPLVIRSLTERG